MQTFNINIEKSIEAIKLILKNTGETCDFHKIFKILYFADMKHLSKYGRPVIGDSYIAMFDGPVPSRIYDLLKGLRNKGTKNDFYKYFEVVNRFIVTLKDKNIDLEIFSESEFEALQESIFENKELSYKELIFKSHGDAYNLSDRDNIISYIELAKEGGADEKISNYMTHLFEVEKIVSDGKSW